ncbi:MAG TPA: nitrite/sulfite reductase [Kofleriaceae bacterium]|nr:nitrite/sulfite reductase [Kofleriaceae bacterium]
MTPPTWKESLQDRMPAALAEEIDVFETQMTLRRQGRLDEKIFAETRLRRGVYGQRYDNGQRHDGLAVRTLEYPCGTLTKGPETMWDAPGMVRIKVPMGRLTAEQLDVLAELAEEYSDSILHVTTRQDIQLHFVHLDDTPDLMRRLAAVGITTREACGNSVRNVTACQFAGVCSDQAFDVTPHADALTYYLLGHKDTQDFGRKFKIAFSGCKPHPCGLANFHDIGAIAVVREEGGVVRRGFELYVGGGLGAVPQQAKLLDEFVSEEELLPLAQAICRVFARLGERKNRARARLKFVVQKLGIDEFRRVVREERERIPADERWTAYLDHLDDSPEVPVSAGRALDHELEPACARWRATNVRPQPQPGYVVATVRLPLGDLTSTAARQVADLARRFTGDTIRLTVEQNLVLRWLPEADIPALHRELERIELGQAGASTISDITSCPGTDTCKLGISSSRGLAAALTDRLAERDVAALNGTAADLDRLHIKVSGCFNSCGQHHVADIGFLGVSRNVGGRRVAHFQLVVGGEWDNNGGSYGLAIGAFPSRRIPEVVDRLTSVWLRDRQPGERLQAFIQRVGRARIKETLEDLRHVPGYDEDRSLYTDWGDAREYTIGDMGVGECAGEVVSAAEFGLAASEREVFEAQLHLEAGDAGRAASLAYRAMVSAARALVQVDNIDVGDDPDQVVSEFRTRFHDTQRFDPSAGARFAAFLLRAHEAPLDRPDRERAHQRIEEAQLFIEAAHASYDRLQESQAAATRGGAQASA